MGFVLTIHVHPFVKAGMVIFGQIRPPRQANEAPHWRSASSSRRCIGLGKPVLAGTRITVESILDKFAAGETLDQLLDAYPKLTREAVFAAFAYAAAVLRSDTIYPLSDQAA